MPKIMLAHTVCFFFLGSILSDFEGSLGFFTFGDGGRGVETENPGQIHWYYNLVLNKTCKDNGMYRENWWGDGIQLKKNYLQFLKGSSQTARVKVVWNSSAADNRPFHGLWRHLDWGGGDKPA